MTPINLNKARKARAKDKARARADENAVKFGRTKSEKSRDTQQAETTKSRLGAHKRER